MNNGKTFLMQNITVQPKDDGTSLKSDAGAITRNTPGKLRIASICCGATLSLLAFFTITLATAGQNPDHKGSIVDELKISQAKQKGGEIQIGPNGMAYNTKTGEVYKVEADSGKIGNNAGGDVFGEYKIKSVYLEEYQKLPKNQQQKIISYFNEAKEKMADPKNVSKITQKWIYFYKELNNVKEYLDKKGNIENFSVGQNLASVLEEIQKLCPDMVTKKDLLDAENFDNLFQKFVIERGKIAKEEGKRAEEEGKRAEEEGKKARDEGKKARAEGKKARAEIEKMQKLIDLIKQFDKK